MKFSLFASEKIPVYCMDKFSYAEDVFHPVHENVGISDGSMFVPITVP